MATNIATLKEQKVAQAFLRYLKADWHNNLLVLAIVAWLRAESGKNLVSLHGNNPFGVVHKVLVAGGTHYDPVLDAIVRDAPRYANELMKFKTLDQGIAAAAKAILNGTAANGLRLVLTAIRRGDPADVLKAIIYSTWDSHHYYDSTGKHNRLIDLYNSFTGLALPPQPPAKRPRPPRIANVPKFLRPQFLVPNYLSGFAAHRFYNERHHADADGLDKGDR